MIEYDYWHFVLPPYEKREMDLQAMEGYAEFGRLAAPNPTFLVDESLLGEQVRS
jgi:hypothetical protein